MTQPAEYRLMMARLSTDDGWSLCMLLDQVRRVIENATESPSADASFHHAADQHMEVPMADYVELREAMKRLDKMLSAQMSARLFMELCWEWHNMMEGVS